MCRHTSAPKGLSLSLPFPYLTRTRTHTSPPAFGPPQRRRPLAPNGTEYGKIIVQCCNTTIAADRINQTIVELFVIFYEKQCTILYGPVLRGYM